MIYPVLATVFFSSVFIGVLLFLGFVFKPPIWSKNRRRIQRFALGWFAVYAIFIVFLTGPTELDLYPPKQTSPYHLPWKAGVSRFVAQGNRSFTSHRGYHRYAWDFVMPIGTPILAARAGRVVKVDDTFDGIGIQSNLIMIEHDGGQHSGYAHLRYRGALVKVGDWVQQGQAIAWSGMVGQTVFPHLHFFVTNKDQTASIPISFREVSDGVPRAGHFYKSENFETESNRSIINNN